MNSSPPTSAAVSLPAESGAALRFAREVGRFAWLQLFVQLIGFATGILIVRHLEQREYAFFTIANTMQGTINVLADIGISIGLISIGGRVWQDRHRFGELVSTGLKLRRRLGAASVLIVTPVLYLMLVKSGASVFYAATLIVAVLGGLYVQLSSGVLDVVPRLHSDFRQIQKIDFTGSLARLVIIGALTLVFLNAGLAVFVGSGMLLLQYLMLRRYVAGMIDLQAGENAEDRKAMLGFIRSRAANAMFFCVQGQITIFLITFFGHRVGAVAEVGALGRLAMIFSVLGNLLTNIFAPAFARCQRREQLGRLYAGIVAGVAGFTLFVLGGAALLPDAFLFVLGSKYAHLQDALLLMVGVAVLNMMASTLWTLNASRAWIVGSWLYIPLTIGTQLLLIPFSKFSSVEGVLTFNLISVIPGLLLNLGLSYRGFLDFPAKTSQDSARTVVKSPPGSLRILAMVSLPWDGKLGAPRVWIELAKEWTRSGHTVEKYCLTDAFPGPETSRVRFALQQVLFPWRAAAFVRRNADRFDVIDGLIGTLPFPKSSLRFRGLIVARSVGLYRLYRQFISQERTLWPDQPKGRLLGGLFYRFIAWRLWKNSEKSVRYCDLLSLPNEDELMELARDPRIEAPCLVQPYGLTEEFRNCLAAAALPPAERLRQQKICFIGMWSLRKGARDWPRIIAAIRQQQPAAQFLFLGTLADEKVVRSGLGDAKNITCRATFEASELPSLLADCALALFPSYVEGFGLAVLEQLAAGLPTIAYDVPGPRQILQPQRARFLTPAADTTAIATRAVEILSLSVAEYEKLSTECRAIAGNYCWSKIASDTLDEFRTALGSLGTQPTE